MDRLEWARNEIKIASDAEIRASDDIDDANYGIECLKSAFKAYESLMEDGHSGASISLTKAILDKLIEGKPLTPITDENTEWDYRYEISDTGWEVYQCSRMSSLFKSVNKFDGSVKYSDVNRVVCVEDTDNHHIPYSNGHVRNIVDKLDPIKMPYDGHKQWTVTCHTFLVDPNCGDFDTRAILYANCSDGRDLNINRYFKDDPNSADFVEIDLLEYNKRLEEYKKRMEKLSFLNYLNLFQKYKERTENEQHE